MNHSIRELLYKAEASLRGSSGLEPGFSSGLDYLRAANAFLDLGYPLTVAVAIDTDSGLAAGLAAVPAYKATEGN